MNDVELSNFIRKLKSLNLHATKYGYVKTDNDIDVLYATVSAHDVFNLPYISGEDYLEVCNIMGKHSFEIILES